MLRLVVFSSQLDVRPKVKNAHFCGLPNDRNARQARGAFCSF